MLKGASRNTVLSLPQHAPTCARFQTTTEGWSPRVKHSVSRISAIPQGVIPQCSGRFKSLGPHVRYQKYHVYGRRSLLGAFLAVARGHSEPPDPLRSSAFAPFSFWGVNPQNNLELRFAERIAQTILVRVVESHLCEWPKPSSGDGGMS